MKPSIEQLERRETPAAHLLPGGALIITAPAAGTVVSVDAGTVTQDGVTTPTPGVTSVTVLGSPAADVIQVNVSLPTFLLGLGGSDTLFGGTGTNYIDAGPGADTVYALLGTNTIRSADSAVDLVFTNFGATVAGDPQDVVARFFGPGRTPGVPFVGVQDGVLYVTPSNSGSTTRIVDNGRLGSVVVYADLGDGLTRRQAFSGVKAISYFGGSGSDVLTVDSILPGAAYGSAGNDRLTGGYGGFFLLKGSGGSDQLFGRSRRNDVSGNGGTDTITLTGGLGGNVVRDDASGTLTGFRAGDVRLFS